MNKSNENDKPKSINDKIAIFQVKKEDSKINLDKSKQLQQQKNQIKIINENENKAEINKEEDEEINNNLKINNKILNLNFRDKINKFDQKNNDDDNKNNNNT